MKLIKWWRILILSKFSERVRKAKKSVEIREKFKDIEPLKQKLKDLKEKNGKEYATEEIPKIRVIQIPMKNIDLDKLDELSIDYLRDLHKDIFGTYVLRLKGYGKKWIARKIRASFKTK